MKILLLADTMRMNELLNPATQLPPGVYCQELITAVPGIEFCIDLLFDESKERIRLLTQAFPCPVAVNAVSTTLAELPPGFTRFNGWPGFLNGPLIEAAAGEENKIITELAFAVFGKKPEWVADISGFITARVVSMIINEAYYAFDEELSSKQEIDTAMKLGTNYPLGPFEWSEKIGLKKIVALLQKLSVTNTRYLPAPLMERQLKEQWP